MIFPLHAAILIVACLYAGSSAAARDSQPFRLVTMYAAFFFLSKLSEYFTLEYNLEYNLQTLIACFGAWILCMYAASMKRCVYVDVFCALMILAIINQLAMFIAYLNLAGLSYILAVGIYESLAFSFSILDIFVLFLVINGNNTPSDAVDSRQRTSLMDSLPNNYFSASAIQANGWAERKATDKQRPKRRR